MTGFSALDSIQPAFSLGKIIKWSRRYSGPSARVTGLYFFECRMAVNSGQFTDPRSHIPLVTFFYYIGNEKAFHFSPIGENRKSGGQTADGFLVVSPTVPESLQI
jgi:hypothetical protein